MSRGIIGHLTLLVYLPDFTWILLDSYCGITNQVVFYVLHVVAGDHDELHQFDGSLEKSREVGTKEKVRTEWTTLGFIVQQC